MADPSPPTVCCMCGDVGFSDKLFSCRRCRFRFQHSYCSSYFSESCSDRAEICDWCQSQGSRAKRSAVDARSAYVSGPAGIKRQDDSGSPTASASASRRSPVPSPRQTTRRYKLLKDVMC